MAIDGNAAEGKKDKSEMSNVCVRGNILFRGAEDKEMSVLSKMKKQDVSESLPPEPEPGNVPDEAEGNSAAPPEGSGGEPESGQEPGEGDSLAAELAAEKDRYLRLAAEYDNFRKRSQKEREAIYTDVRAETITKLLPVYDNLSRALKTQCADEAFYKGVELIMTQLMEIMDGMGVTEIEAVGQVFDPNLHNAVMSVEDPQLGEKVIAQEFEKGFMLGGRVIRFSTVAVAN